MGKSAVNTISIWSLILLLFSTSCQKEENIKSASGKPEKALVGYSGGDNSLNRIRVVHLYKDTVYILSETFSRNTGEQLIIDEGVLVKVASGGQLIGINIYPGGSIIATGTRLNPIVFTSDALTGNQQANWGGIVIQGSSTSNSGIPGNPEDFSGLLMYVRIEFGGLVLKSAGHNTFVENVQVSYAAPQSSFEFDGGTFDAKNLISYACGGPADFYFTGGYTGKLQNLLAYRHPFFGAPGNSPANVLAGVFIENNRYGLPDAIPYTFPVISNLTVLGPDGKNGSAPSYTDTTLRSAALVTTGNAYFHIRNAVLSGFTRAGWWLDDSATARRIQYQESEFSSSFLQSGDVTNTFFLAPGKYPPYTSADFRDFILAAPLKNQVLEHSADFKFNDPFNFDKGPDPTPGTNSPLLQGADFTGPVYSDVFFDKVSFIGALGKDNWMNGWSNFLPLKTNYNFP